MEAAGLVGDAVGEEVFSNDALEIMQLLLSSLNDGDIAYEYALPACARISKCLGAKFEPFLPMIIGPVLTGANQQIDFSMVDADEGEEEGDVVQDEETGVQSAVISLGGGVRKRVTLNTHAIQQKNQCARIIYELASNLKGNLNTYLTPLYDSILPMIIDKHSADIRASASLSLSTLSLAYIDAYKLGYKDINEIENIIKNMISSLLIAIQGEINGTSRLCATESLRDILVNIYESGNENYYGQYINHAIKLNIDIYNNMIQMILLQCQSTLTRRQEKVNLLTQNEGLDEEDRDASSDEITEEDELLSLYADILGQNLKLGGIELMPLFEKEVIPCLSPFLSTNQPDSLQVIAVCIIDDIIEYGGEYAQKYISQSLITFINNLTSTHLILVQSSCYGIAQILLKYPQYTIDNLEGIIRVLVALIQSSSAKQEDHEGITENAIFSLGLIITTKMLRTSTYLVPQLFELSKLWLSSLPLRIDNSESKITSCLICDVIEQWDTSIIGENTEISSGKSNVEALFGVVADIISSAPVLEDSLPTKYNGFKNPIAHSNTHQRLEKCCVQLFTLSHEIITNVMNKCDVNQKNVLLQYKM
mmetsp:Transcript_38631/g.39326  ORF Transcript_38631/g.39326 Transcript_38631/m.39326 type:complete len:592 (-) Transcript_38631:23-1798(-)